jgi:hypothetical protein
MYTSIYIHTGRYIQTHLDTGLHTYTSKYIVYKQYIQIHTWRLDRGMIALILQYMHVHAYPNSTYQYNHIQANTHYDVHACIGFPYHVHMTIVHAYTYKYMQYKPPK